MPLDLADALRNDKDTDHDIISESYIVYSERWIAGAEAVRIAKNRVIENRRKAHNLFGAGIGSRVDYTLSDLIRSYNHHSGYLAALCDYVSCTYEEARSILRKQRAYVAQNGLPEELQRISDSADPELEIIKMIEAAIRKDSAQMDMLDFLDQIEMEADQVEWLAA